MYSTGPIIRKPETLALWLDCHISYLRKGVFRTNFSVTAPDFLISPGILGRVSCETLSCEGTGTIRTVCDSSGEDIKDCPCMLAGAST